MEKRKIEKTTKKIVCEELGLSSSQVSVCKGRGSACNWIDIVTSKKISDYVRDRVEKKLVAEKRCGKYYTDYGPKNSWEPCVTWRDSVAGPFTIDPNKWKPLSESMGVKSCGD